MKWWKAIADLCGPKFADAPAVPPWPPLGAVQREPIRNPDLDIPNRLADSCIARLSRENAELRAQIRSLRSSKGNLTKKLNRERAARMTGA